MAHKEREVKAECPWGVALDILSAQPSTAVMEICYRIRVAYLFCSGPERRNDMNGVHSGPFHIPSFTREPDLSRPGNPNPSNLALGNKILILSP